MVNGQLPPQPVQPYVQPYQVPTYSVIPVNPPEYYEKREIKKYSNVFGAAICIAEFAVTVLIIILTTMLKGNNLVSDIFSGLGTEMQNIIIQIVFSILMFVPTFIICSKILKQPVSRLIRLGRVPAKIMLPAVGIGLCVTSVANILTSEFVQLFGDTLSDSYSADLGGIPSSASGIILYLLTISLLPAFIEEFAFRGIMLGSMRKFGDQFAILSSALLFSVIHGNFVQIPFAFICGLIFGYLTVKTNSIIPAMIVHFLNNLMSGVLEVIMSFNVSDKMINLLNVSLIALFIISGIIGAYILGKKGMNFSVGCGTMRISTSDKVKASCSSVGFILCFVLFGLSAASYIMINMVNSSYPGV